jgi:AcrR family transcriptional regulator
MDEPIIFSDPRPTRADAVRNREHILTIARALLEAHGVEGVTMSAIAQEAGVGKGTLYRNFPDKLALCQALLDHDQRALQERTLARLRAQGNPEADLLWFIGEVIGFVWAHLDLFGGETDMPLPFGHPAHYWWRQTLRGIIHRIDARLNADLLADSIYILLDPRALSWQRVAHGYDAESFTRAFTPLVARLVTPLPG